MVSETDRLDTDVLWCVRSYDDAPMPVTIVAGSATDKTALGWRWGRPESGEKPRRFNLRASGEAHFTTYLRAREHIIEQAYSRRDAALEKAERANAALDAALELPSEAPSDD